MTDQATSAPAAGSSQLNETVSAAHARLHKTFQSGKTLPLSWRRSQLQALGRFVNTHESDILSALYNDLHRPPNESLSFSLLQLRADIHHLMNNLTRLTKPKPMGRHFLAPGYQVPSPKGAVAILAPSNFPIFLACRPLAAAFAAGNTALLKLSEFAPASEKFLLKLRDVLDADAFAVFTGEAQVSKEIVSLPWDHLFFTGSPNVGKVIMAAAAKHLTPVTLELGGKNPAFILGDADLKSAARSIVRSRYYNSGQVCIATDFCIVEECVYGAFLDALSAAVRERFGEDPSKSEQYARLSPRSFENVVNLLSKTRGRIVCGGQTNADDNYAEPTVVATSSDDILLGDEIFGPILPVIRMQDVSDGLHEITKRPHPLCLYIFTQNDAMAERVLNATRSGSACVNDTMFQVGFTGSFLGGVGGSGLGGGCGYDEGFHAFTHRRCVLKSNPSVASIFHHILQPKFSLSPVGKIVLKAATGQGLQGIYIFFAKIGSYCVSGFDKLRFIFQKLTKSKRICDEPKGPQ